MVRHALPILAALLAGCGIPRIRAFDALALPGEEIGLRARAERDGLPGFSPELEDEELTMTLPGGDPVAARTGDEGAAVFPVRAPERRGEFVHSISGGRGIEPGLLRLYVRPPDEPLLLVDIDGTIVSSGPLAAIRGEDEPVPGAAAVLRRLARNFTIVYFTARDDSMLASTRDFLARGRFPPGPLFVRDFTLWSSPSAPYKAAALRALRERFRGPWTGIGDTVGDAEACLAAGAAVLILTDDPCSLPPGAEAVRDWREIRERLMNCQ
jgi:phosphatidate phosphatase APP1